MVYLITVTNTQLQTFLFPFFRSPCTLNSFIADYVKEVFLGRHHVIVATTIDTATKDPEAWRATTPPEVMKDLGLTRPLLQVEFAL